MISAVLLLSLAQAGATFPAAATASWVTRPCDALIVAPETPGDSEAAQAVLAAISEAAVCARVRASATEWNPGWTIEQELVVRRQLGNASQLVVVRASALSFFDGRGESLAEVPFTAGTPISAGKPRAIEPPPAPFTFTQLEMHLEPLAVQVNPMIDQQFLGRFSVAFRPLWLVGITASATGGIFYLPGPDRNLLALRLSPLPQAYLRLNWAVMIGAEVTPLKFVVTPYLAAEGGLARTSHVLRVENASGPTTTADSGFRPAGSFAIGVRWQPIKHLTLRLELRDLITAGAATTLNGCDEPDLRSLDNASRAGKPLSTAAVSAGCSAQGFFSNPNDVPLAHNMVQTPDVPLTHIVTVTAGIGVAF